MNAKNILVKATAAVAIATVGFVGLSATAANAAKAPDFYSKGADAPTDSDALRDDSKGAKAKTSVVGGELNAGGRKDIYVKKNGTHKFRLTWSGFKGKKVVLWVKSGGEIGDDATESSWMRIETKNKAGRNSKVIDYRFDQADLSGNWSSLHLVVVDAKGTFANNGDACFYVQEDTPENRNPGGGGIIVG